MVGSGTRKACAISAVPSPPSSRRVSATWAAGASAGWQQVKIRRSRSSRTAPAGAGGSSGASSRAASACRSARDASRRSRSTARLRAVVMIQPAALAGGPADGQRCSATVKASWTASSATSMSPNRRTRTATARPYSSRNTRSTSRVAAARAGSPGVAVPPPWSPGVAVSSGPGGVAGVTAALRTGARPGTAGPRSGGWSPRRPGGPSRGPRPGPVRGSPRTRRGAPCPPCTGRRW